MLKQLHISNYALIDELSVDFEPNFSVITGETGAGKSILLGALGFVTGDRSDAGVLFDKDRKCIVEATFVLKDDSMKAVFDENDLDFDLECTLRRELTPQKKTRAFINDTPVSAQTLKDIGCQLVDIHSQHDSLLLTSADFQIRLLDEIAHNETILEQYKTELANYNSIKRRLEELKEMAMKNVSENDFLKFQLEELDKAALRVGEYDEIVQALNIMENAEEIKTLLYGANSLLQDSETAILSQVNDLSALLSRLKKLLPETADLDGRVESLSVELKDIAYDMERLGNDTQFDENELQSLQERQDFLNRLMMKHHVDNPDALVTLKEEIASKVNAFENIDEEIAKTEKTLKKKKKDVDDIASTLHDRRQLASKSFEDNVTGMVRQLAMPYAVFSIAIDHLDTFTANGSDSIRFLFSANKGVAVDDIERVASGGELSRLMLAIKSAVSQYNYIPTLIFDEIDAGVSGEVAARLGSIMSAMGQNLQLIAITHLPQVASKAKHHFFIYKDNDSARTQSHIRLLQPGERVTEIAKMLSNDKVTEEAIKAAEVLLR